MKLGRELRAKLHRHIQSALLRPEESFWKRAVVWVILASVTLALLGLFLFTLTIGVLSIGLPDVRDFDKLAGVESTLILDREGGILYTIHGEENRKYVPLSEITPLLQKATIAIEDDEFYRHSGFDIPGIAKGFLHELFGIGGRRGGSTITQQLAKNAFLSSQRSYLRKLKELILSIRLERAYDKNKILELYLNRIPYGNNAYGAELASKMYFGKSASALTLAESVILASLPKAPTFYSPYGPNAHSKLERDFGQQSGTPPGGRFPKTVADLAQEDYTIGLVGQEVAFTDADRLYLPGRADIVLKRMEELGFIETEEKEAALKEIRQMNFQKYKERIRAAHFVFYVRSLLEEQFGKDLVAQGGLQVYTTLDPKLQAAAEDIVAKQIETSKQLYGVSNGALFSVSPRNGEVLAMVGAADYFDEAARGNVNHVFAKRQPGSSFKPIVYAQTFTKGYSPATVLYDTPTDFGNNYRPQNFEGGFRGPMTIRQALGQSRNLPALKAYFLAGEQGEIIGLANKMGIETLAPGGDYGPPLAIGAGEVKLSEMVQAFSVFAAGGIRRDFYSIVKVVDRDGDMLYERKPQDHPDQPVLDPQVVYLVNSILSDKSVYLGQRLDVLGHATAAKTGTSNKEITPTKILPSNVWTIGYTPSVVTGVWAGNSDGSALKLNADGYNVAAPMWSRFMAEALKSQPYESFQVPEGIKRMTISRGSGKLPSADTPDFAKISEVFASFSVPTEVDDIYKTVEINKLDGLLPNEYTPKEQIEKKLFMNHHDPISDYGRWMTGIKQWLVKKRGEEPSYPDFPPRETTKIFTAETASRPPSITILTPSAFSTVSGSDMEVEVRVEAPNGVNRVVYFLDERNLSSSTQREFPYTGKIHFPRATKSGTHSVTAKVFDKIGYVAQAKVEFRYEKTISQTGGEVSTSNTSPP